MKTKNLKLKYVVPSLGFVYLLCFDNGSKRELDCKTLINEKPEFKVLNKNKVFWYATVDRFHKKIEFTEDLSLSIEDAVKYSRVYDAKKENKKQMRLIYNFGKEERKRKRITQEQMADMVGVPQSSIARLEKGETDAQLSTILNYLSPLGLTLKVSEKNEPNDTTLRAMLEEDEMNDNPKKYKRYDSFADILKEI